MSIDPKHILTEAIAAVPAMRYALAVAGLVAALAIIASFKLGWPVAAFGTVAILVAMVALIVVARLAGAGGDHPAGTLPVLEGPAFIMVWVFTLLVCATSVMMFMVTFFGKPRTWDDILGKFAATGTVTPTLTGDGPDSLIVFGRVFDERDERNGLEGFTVFLEAERTFRTTSGENGDFSFRLPPISAVSSAYYWAIPDSVQQYVPSARAELHLADPLPKLGIPVPPLRPVPEAPPRRPTGERVVRPDVDQRIIGNVGSFEFNYEFGADPGLRRWTRSAGGNWTETFPSGSTSSSVPTERTTVDGCIGVVVTPHNDPSFEVFIPDIGCNLMWLRHRENRGDWAFLGEMRGIQADGR